MKEKEIEKILVDEVRGLGGRVYKWISPGNDGVPDRIVILPGRVPIFAELKTETGKLSPLQKIQLERLDKLGQPVAVIYGKKGLISFFEVYGFDDTASKLSKRFLKRR